MDALKRSEFFEHFTAEVFLSQYAAMEKLDPATIRLADERRLRRPVGIRRSEGPREPDPQGARGSRRDVAPRPRARSVGAFSTE
jgi:hypothetical protein